MKIPFRRKRVREALADPVENRRMRRSPFKKGLKPKEALKQHAKAARENSGMGRDRIVLLVGDEGAVLVHMKRGKLLNRMFAPTPVSPEAQAMRESLRKTPHSPIYLVFDTMDQSYVQQSLPPVTALSVKKLVSRRLERDFAGDYIKGALLLGKSQEGAKDWQFMMAALQQTSVVKGWLEMVAEWPNPCRGVLLLPVESIEILTRLQQALRKHRGPLANGETEWQILVSYNKVSGIRQVVFNNGRMVLTRLSQPALDSSVETIAGTIEQEIISTKDYLKRLAQQDGEGLHVTILGSEDICRHIDVTRMGVSQVEAVTPFQAAEMLGLRAAAQPTDRFGDSLLGAMLCTNRKRHLQLSVPMLRGQQIFSTALLAQRGVAAAIVFALLCYIGSSLWNLHALADELDSLRHRQMAKQHDMDELKKKLPRSPEQLERIVTVMDMYATLGSEAYSPEKLLIGISQNFSTRLRVNEFTWELRDKKITVQKQLGSVPSPAPVTASAGQQAESTLTLEFPAAIAADRKRLEPETTDILNQFKGKFPNFQMSYVMLPSILSDAERIDVDLGQGKTAKPPEAKPLQTQARLALVGPADAEETGDGNGGSQAKTAGH